MSSKDGKFGSLVPVVAKFLYLNQITVMAGGPYAGKSRLNLKMAVDLASGASTVLGGPYAPMPVLYCSERDWDFTTEQLRTIGVDSLPPLLKMFCVPDIPQNEVSIFETDPLSYISKRYFIPEYHARLVTFDTLPYFQSVGAQFDISSYGLNRRDLLRMKRWATANHCAVIALCHSPKQNERNRYEDPFDKVIGSTAILASTVAASIIERVSENYIRVHFRSHVAQLETPRYFRYADLSECDSGEALCDDPPIELVPLGQRQIDVLNMIPMEFVEFGELLKNISKQLKSSENNVRNLISDLDKKGQVNIDTDVLNKVKRIKRVRVVVDFKPAATIQ